MKLLTSKFAAMSLLTTLKTMGRFGLVCGAIVSCAFAKDTCGVETFSGAYSFTITGFVLPARRACAFFDFT
jgi:hypothetical protein